MTIHDYGHVAVCGSPFDATLAFFVDELDMRLERVSPADDPSVAIVSGHGLTLRIDQSVTTTPALCIESGHAASVVAPNGMQINFADPAAESVVVPELVPELVISRASSEASWVIGRAGMRYRDLIPSRLGGRYIASHIEVCDGGPVPDLVHHHAIRFQMIFCHHGWVDVVYEDQGDAFRLEAGDCVLQPPHIRHRVLASSAGAQVIEIGCPAEHDTFFDYELDLPTTQIDPEREFGGQRFVRHQATEVAWQPSTRAGFEEQHTAIEAATNGLARVHVIRNSSSETTTTPTHHDGDFWFFVVLSGSTDVAFDGLADDATALGVGDSVAVPAGLTWSLSNASPDLVLLEVAVP